MLEGIILGTIQGITEWLPISSEGMVALFGINFLGWTDLNNIISYAIFLHLGTFLAGLVYFRRDIWRIVLSLKQRDGGSEDYKILKFLIVSTIITGVLGGGLLFLIKNLGEISSAKYLNLIIGFALVITGLLQFKKDNNKSRILNDLNFKDAVLLGFSQSFSIIPGLSRSGLTIATLLFRKFDDGIAIRLSFLMSLPVVFGANIILNLKDFSLEKFSLLAVFFAFIFGLLTIHGLLYLSKKIKWGSFALFFGLLILVSIFV